MGQKMGQRMKQRIKQKNYLNINGLQIPLIQYTYKI